MEETKTSFDIVEELLATRDDAGTSEYLATLHPNDIAMIFETMDNEEDMAFLFKLLPPEVASEVFVEVDDRFRESLLSFISATELVEVVDEMETDDAADVISDLPTEDARAVLEGIDEEESIEVRKLLRYAEDTAGGKMQAELVRVLSDATVDETIEEVRKLSPLVDNITNVFVVSGDGVLEGVISLDKLILGDSRTLISRIMDPEPIKVQTDLDQEEVARIFQRYDLLTMPVVDHMNKLVGRITVDDVVDVIEEEIFEDFYRMASLNAGERALDPPVRSFRMRVPWLLLNLVTAFFAASVVKVFQSTIEALVILAVMMPVVAGLGGNAATQTITVVIRGLALGELELRHARRVLFKEAVVGLFNGLIVGLVAALAAYLLGSSAMLGILLFMAMTANLFIAAIGGATIPLILKWLKLDPALSSSIFVTACTDIGGFFTFLGLASVFMKLGFL
jgi:magnesium transporter